MTFQFHIASIVGGGIVSLIIDCVIAGFSDSSMTVQIVGDAVEAAKWSKSHQTDDGDEQKERDENESDNEDGECVIPGLFLLLLDSWSWLGSIA